MTDTNITDEQLLADLGIEVEAEAQPSGSARESRILAGFEEIEKFVEAAGRLPQHGEDKDIFELFMKHDFQGVVQKIRAFQDFLPGQQHNPKVSATTISKWLSLLKSANAIENKNIVPLAWNIVSI